MSKKPAASLEPTYLRCEYKVDPLGIDVLKPRLSWVLKSTQPDLRGQKQTAYEIRIADTHDGLAKTKGILWNSGQVQSSSTSQIVYDGTPLVSNGEYWWKARVWDQNGLPSGWSAPARWTTGILSDSEWQAKWIGYDEPVPTPKVPKSVSDELSLSGGRWVWFQEGNPVVEVPAATRFFRHKIIIPKNEKVQYAGIFITADDQFTLYVNGAEKGKSDGKQGAWERPQLINITDSIAVGENTLAVEATNSTPGPAGLAGKIVIKFKSGHFQSYWISGAWKAFNERVEGWEKPRFDDGAWPNAWEFGWMGTPPWGVPTQKNFLHLPPPPYLRKSFALNKPVKRAMLFASALGIYEVQINGQRVGKDIFTPGWTDYRKRVYYNTYEVTDLLKRKNAIGAILGDGWYAGHVAWGSIRERYGKQPRFYAQLSIEFEDGTTKMIVTDDSWKAAYGPLQEADFLMGETYDAREELDGWDTAKFDDSAWRSVAVTENIPAKIESYPGVTVRKIEEIKPQKRSEPAPGVFVFDLGQNMVGWVRLKARGKAGQKVQMRFAEMLNDDGTPYLTNLRGARSTDMYVLKGEGEEVWEPRFTFHGFRYVEVTGYPGQPELDDVTGVVIHSAAPSTADFECSDAMVNQLYHNIVWGQKGNYLEVPTDCPQRDERLGWTGDAQVFVRTASYNMDIAAFYTKWLVDLCDAQHENGAFTDIAPDLGLGSGTPAWADAGIVCPYTILKVYGDQRIVDERYDSLVKYIDYLKNHSADLLRPDHGYGDWLSINADTPKDVIGTAYFAYVVRLMSELADLTGRKSDGEKYRQLFDDIKSAFNKAYVAEDGRIKGNTQTCYALALYIDLLPEPQGKKALQYLVDDIMSRDGGHLSCGFVGLPILLPTLTRFGRNDLAYKLLLNDTFPSWGYEIKHGATTIWERWDGWTADKGFQDPGMNSFNHYAFGAVGEWMFRVVAGIDTDGPGFEKIIIRPLPDPRLTHVKAHYDSINGRIVSEWGAKDGEFQLKVTVPANTTATIHVPAKDPSMVREGGRKRSTGVKFIEMKDGAAVYQVGSGEYIFAVSER